MADEFIVQSAIPERLYVKTYHDFLDSELLNGKEKLVFILLKRYLNFKDDSGGVAGKVYPTLETLSKQAGMTKKTVADIIKKLEKKGIIEVKQQGLNRPNIYSIRDFSGIWKSKTDDEVKAAIDTYEEEYENSLMIERLRNKGYRVVKEKEPDNTEPTKVTVEPSTKNNHNRDNNNTVKSSKSQELERYSEDDVKALYDYDIMIHDNPLMKNDIDTILFYVKEVLNCTKPTIRVCGENKPTMVVISQFMKLTYSEILYVVDKFKEQTDRVNNQEAYILTLLYKAKEQMNLDITNQVSHDMSHWNDNKDDD